jgi:hypothetical protein
MIAFTAHYADLFSFFALYCQGTLSVERGHSRMRCHRGILWVRLLSLDCGDDFLKGHSPCTPRLLQSNLLIQFSNLFNGNTFPISSYMPSLCALCIRWCRKACSHHLAGCLMIIINLPFARCRHNPFVFHIHAVKLW